jgi:hypothetical protein
MLRHPLALFRSALRADTDQPTTRTYYGPRTDPVDPRTALDLPAARPRLVLIHGGLVAGAAPGHDEVAARNRMIAAIARWGWTA